MFHLLKAFIYHKFYYEGECNHMLKQAKAATNHCRMQAKKLDGAKPSVYSPEPLSTTLAPFPLISRICQKQSSRPLLILVSAPIPSVSFTVSFCLLCVKLHTGYIHGTCPKPTPIKVGYAVPLHSLSEAVQSKHSHPDSQKEEKKKKKTLRDERSKICLLRGM